MVNKEKLQNAAKCKIFLIIQNDILNKKEGRVYCGLFIYHLSELVAQLKITAANNPAESFSADGQVITCSIISVPSEACRFLHSVSVPPML